MAKHAEGREKSERIVVPVTKDEHAYAKNAAGESGLAGKVREALRDAGLLPPLPPTPLRVGVKSYVAEFGHARTAKAKRGK